MSSVQLLCGVNPSWIEFFQSTLCNRIILTVPFEIPMIIIIFVQITKTIASMLEHFFDRLSCQLNILLCNCNF